MTPRALPLLLCAASLLGCEWDFERMIDQPSLRPYERTAYFDDETTMQRAPAGTVAWRSTPDPALSGRQGPDAGFTQQIPIGLDRERLRRGADRFALFCSPCHGARGDGDSPVARSMTLRPPPSLVEPPVSTSAPGRVYTVISEGYGMMPSYAHVLPPGDRWAVVAFVEVLRLARRAPLAELSPQRRAEAMRWLR